MGCCRPDCTGTPVPFWTLYGRPEGRLAPVWQGPGRQPNGQCQSAGGCCRLGPGPTFPWCMDVPPSRAERCQSGIPTV